MLHEDLEEVTSRQLREKLEKEMDMQLNEYREFLDRHMLRILGQLEQPSKILDYLYLVCVCVCSVWVGQLGLGNTLCLAI